MSLIMRVTITTNYITTNVKIITVWIASTKVTVINSSVMIISKVNAKK